MSTSTQATPTSTPEPGAVPTPMQPPPGSFEVLAPALPAALATLVKRAVQDIGNFLAGTPTSSSSTTGVSQG
jgi:hypothetical protein